jgi:hypothetical protein
MDFNFSLHNKQLEVSTVIEDFTNDNGQFSSCNVGITVDAMADVLLAVYSHLTPRIYAIEANCKYEVLVGSEIITALSYFIQGGVHYPTDGLITDFQGKMFSELSRRDQRRLTSETLCVTTLASYSGNKGKEDAFRTVVNKITAM